MTNWSIRKAVVALAAMLTLVLLLGPNVSAASARADEQARIVVYLIKASDGSPGVDPEIRSIVKQFGGAFRYSSYRLVSKIPKSVPMGGDVRIALPGSREMRVYANGRENNRIRLKIRVKEKSVQGREREILNTEFRIVEGGTIMIGGYNYHDGKLMVAISADM